MSGGVFLETERLVLRDKRADDFAFLLALYQDPQVMRFIGDGHTYSRDEVEARFFRVLAIENEPGHERWDAFKILERKADGARIGQAGILRCEIDGAPEVEIGWWLAPFAWGRGYATEAALALRGFAFREAGVGRLCVVLHAANEKSVAVARRIGGPGAVPRPLGHSVHPRATGPGATFSAVSAVEPLTMLKRDLTTSYPRSVRDKVLGVVQVGRAIDKGIAYANGLNGEYNYDCPMDKAVLGFLGVDGDALLETIKKAQNESEIEAYLKPYVDKKTSAEIEAFNQKFLVSGPQPGSDGETYFLNLRSEVAPDRTDVTAWPDLLDLDEKRDVPRREPQRAGV